MAVWGNKTHGMMPNVWAQHPAFAYHKHAWSSKDDDNDDQAQ